jgi:O-6-methylguanine DNA methyltransferase
MDSPVGPLTLTASDNALISIEFKQNLLKEECEVLKQTKLELELYFKGKLKKFSIKLDLNGTDFQQKCWFQLKKINYGKTISYKQEAIKLGGANYSRAVAGANNKNRIPIIIPCHRVIGSDGSLVGYAGGLKVKQYLINLESANR